MKPRKDAGIENLPLHKRLKKLISIQRVHNCKDQLKMLVWTTWTYYVHLPSTCFIYVLLQVPRRDIRDLPEWSEPPEPQLNFYRPLPDAS